MYFSARFVVKPVKLFLIMIALVRLTFQYRLFPYTELWGNSLELTIEVLSQTTQTCIIDSFGWGGSRAGGEGSMFGIWVSSFNILSWEPPSGF